MKFDIPHITFIKEHERLLIVIAILVFGWWGYGKYLDHEDMKSHESLATQTDQLNQIKNQNALLGNIVAEDRKSLADYRLEVQAKDAAYRKAIESRDSALAGQREKDKSLSLPDTGIRWSMLLGLQTGEIQASEGRLSISELGAHKTLDSLERIPTLEGDLGDVNSQLTSKKGEVDRLNNLVLGLTNESHGKDVQLAKADQVCDARVKVVKDDDDKKLHKARTVWGVIGIIIGAVARGYVK